LQVATAIAAFVNLEFANIRGIGLGWAGVIWLYSLVTYLPLDLFKFAVRYVLSGKAWNNLQNKTAFTTKDFGREEREALWATTQRSLPALQGADDVAVRSSSNQNQVGDVVDVAGEARKRAEIARCYSTYLRGGKLSSSGCLLACIYVHVVICYICCRMRQQTSKGQFEKRLQQRGLHINGRPYYYSM
jgi:H+-transporting ATPase